jgi:Zn-dependent protease
LKIRITPGALLLFLVLAATHTQLLFPTLLAALFHEGGHLLAAGLLRIRLRLLELDLPGARILPATALPSYRAEALLALGGPAASLLLALLLSTRAGGFSAATRLAALSQAAFNLLPVIGFDGGRALAAVLAASLSPSAAEHTMAALSYLSLLFLFSLASCLVLRFGASFTLAVLSATLFAKLFLL